MVITDEFGFEPLRARELARDNEKEAVAYIDHFIELGSIRAMIAKADHLDIRGDRAGSLAWMERAEKAVLDLDPIPSSAVYLTSAYTRGLGTGTAIERRQKALKILERIGETGNLAVIHELMTNYLHGANGAPQDDERFIYWTRKAAALGSETAIRALREIDGADTPSRGDE
jgi:TPR repeat protein